MVVIDPGHGGNDFGIAPPSGFYEKHITLTVSKRIAQQLENKFSVILTHSDDYAVDLTERAALANHQKAALFISIHANGSFTSKKKGATVSYFSPVSDMKDIEEKAFDTSTTEGKQQAWESVQASHIQKSEDIAKLIGKYLSEIENLEVTIKKAPLYVLSGTDMPAVLVEIGHLTNPSENQKLNNMEYLNKISSKIYAAVDFFLK